MVANETPSDLVALALHEAGHAVVGTALGMRVDTATVIPDRRSLGRVTWRGLFDEDVFAVSLMLVAGSIAVERV